MDLTLLYQCYSEKAWLLQELRSDHAGETGAVWIYKGILTVSRDDQVRQFSSRHLSTEEGHLALMEQLLPFNERSRLLPLWKLAGFLAGAVPSLFGAQAVYATIEAVEHFVVQHYQPQVERLRKDGANEVANILEQCMHDEMTHQCEARLNLRQSGRLENLLKRVVIAGSGLAVAAARRI